MARGGGRTGITSRHGHRAGLLATVVLLLAAAGVACSGDPQGGAGTARTDPADARGGAAATVVRTTGGDVRGVREGAVESFYGIPYAAAPTGGLRWKAPAPPTLWSGVRDGSRRGHPCPQAGTLAARSGEDCLFVNVTRPAEARPAEARPAGTRSAGTRSAGTARGPGVVTAPASALVPAAVTAPVAARAAGGAGRGAAPVLVWIHGGGFVTGSANDVDMSALAAGGPAVLVGVNYRLGALGQLALPALNAESGGDAGSYSLADLTAGLRWVRDNAAAFGGDPGNVTIFGESAGSVNVCALLASPPARGLFDRAVMQSGPCTWSLPAMATAERTGADLAARLGCTGTGTGTGTGTDGDGERVLQCLRGTPVDRILAASAQADILSPPSWAPVVGGRTLPAPPADTIAAGGAAKVPVVIGTVRDEGRGFTVAWALGGEITDDRVAQIVRAKLPDRADAVLAAYPPGSAPARERLARVITDGVFACPAVRSASLLAEAGAGDGVRVFLYEFDVPGLGPVADGVATGATHAGELPYLFPKPQAGATAGGTGGPTAGGTAGQATPDQRTLSAAMVGYWTRFAATGDPNTTLPGLPGSAGRTSPGPADLPAWPAWSKDRIGAGPDRLALEPGAVGERSGYVGEHHCEIWH